MTLKYEIIKAYHRKDLIGICLCCMEEERERPYHWLADRQEIGGQIETMIKPPMQDYNNYSHGICNEHFEVYKLNNLGTLLAYIKQNRNKNSMR